jgi:hypothetical protein
MNYGDRLIYIDIDIKIYLERIEVAGNINV